MMRKPIPGACDGNGEKVARNGGSSWPGSESFQMSVKEQKPELRCTQTHHVPGIGGPTPGTWPGWPSCTDEVWPARPLLLAP